MAVREDDGMRAHIAALEARIAQLEAERRPAPAPSEPPAPGDTPVSRRRVLGLGGAAVAGAAGAALANVAPAGATTGAMQYGAANNAGTDVTSLTAATNAVTLDVVNTGVGYGISGVGPVGVHGGSTAGNAVQGISSTGRGVYGWSGSGNSLYVDPPDPSVNGSHMYLVPGATSGSPSGTHVRGQFWMDTDGVLWQCVGDGVPGAWVRQAPLVTLPAPVRVFDSRAGQPNGGGSTQGPLTFTSPPPAAAFREVNVSQNAVGGAVVVPAGASAVLMNLAVVSISGVGALAVCKHGATQPGTANINWFAGGQVLSNAVTSAVDANRHVDVVIVAGGGASTHFILDVVGYYL